MEAVVTYEGKSLRIAAALATALAFGPVAAHAQSDAQSCAETLTQQLRRFSEKCLSDLVAYVASQPKMAAKLSSESEKYYVILTRDGDGVTTQAVSRFNHPLMKPETENALKQLGWSPPENESDNWKKRYSGDRLKSGAAAEDIAKALAAYGLTRGQAISLTVAPEISG
jgi:hypothetical protein